MDIANRFCICYNKNGSKKANSGTKSKGKSPVVAATGDFFILLLKSLLTGCYGFHLLSSHVHMMCKSTPVTIVNKANSGIVNVYTSLHCQILCGSKVQYNIVHVFPMSNRVEWVKRFSL